jgi:hypothetical protein
MASVLPLSRIEDNRTLIGLTASPSVGYGRLKGNPRLCFTALRIAATQVTGLIDTQRANTATRTLNGGSTRYNTHCHSAKNECKNNKTNQKNH